MRAVSWLAYLDPGSPHHDSGGTSPLVYVAIAVAVLVLAAAAVWLFRRAVDYRIRREQELRDSDH